MNLMFARHGQASFGQENYDKLSSLGERQARLLGKAYVTAGRSIDAIVTGTMVRQQDSARHFLAEYLIDNLIDNLVDGDSVDNNSADSEQRSWLQPTVIAGFDEFNHQDVLIKSNTAFTTREGVMQAIASSDVPKRKLSELFHIAMTRWHSGEYDADYAESWTAFNARVDEAVQELVQFGMENQHENVLVFTSGGVIACLVAKLMLDAQQIDDSAQYKHKRHGQQSLLAYQTNLRLVNTGVTTVLVDKRVDRKQATDAGSPSLKLLSMNEHSHLYVDGESLLTWY